MQWSSMPNKCQLLMSLKAHNGVSSLHVNTWLSHNAPPVPIISKPLLCAAVESLLVAPAAAGVEHEGLLQQIPLSGGCPCRHELCCYHPNQLQQVQHVRSHTGSRSNSSSRSDLMAAELPAAPSCMQRSAAAPCHSQLLLLAGPAPICCCCYQC
jgi:hypothetical protein